MNNGNFSQRRKSGIFFAVLAAALILLNSPVHASWEEVNPPNVSTNWELFGVGFASSNNAWAVGKDFINNRGVLLRLSGSSVTSIAPPNITNSTNWGLSDIGFPSSSQGWAVGEDVTNKRGVILRFSGGSWTSVTALPSVSLDWKVSSVHFPSSTEGWAVGRNTISSTNTKGAILRFSQGVWTSFTTPDLGPNQNWELTRVHFPSVSSGWAVGKDLSNRRGVILRFSTNAFESIAPPDISSSDWDLRGVHFPSLNEGWAVGTDLSNLSNRRGVILRFFAGTWTPVAGSSLPTVSSDWELNSVHFSSVNEGRAVGRDFVSNRGVILKFSGGAWTSITPSELPDVGLNWKLSDLDFRSSDDGWAVGMEFESGNPKGVLLRKDEPNISVASTNINFRDVAMGAVLDKKITVKNTGTGTLDLGSVGVVDLPFTKRADLCSGVSLAPGQNCQITVRFEPTAEGPFSSGFDILSNDPDQNSVAVELSGNGVSGPVVSIQLNSPSDGGGLTACSTPPAFQWTPNPADAFRSIGLQFALQNDFLIVGVKGKGKRGVNELVLKPKSWKQLLLLPGETGGTVYWMAVGTKADKTMVESDIFSFAVEASTAVGNPQILNTSKAALPALSWENDCNTSFTVWFGNNADFTDPATRKKALSFTIKDPNGNFSITLKPKEWLTIRNLVGDATGSTIFWYVEAEDVLGRPNQTGVMSFDLSD